MVTKDENADIVRTVEAIKALVEKEKQNLPDTIAFLYTNDVSISVRDKFDIVKNNGIMGLVLVLVVLSAFLNIRSSFWVALGIPFSMLGVLILLPLFDVDLDSITMTAMVIVIGIIVDDAIVISENIFQRREKGDAPLEAAVNGVHEVYLPVLASVTTTLLAFLPMFFDERDDGQICVCHSFNHYIGLISVAVRISADSAGPYSAWFNGSSRREKAIIWQNLVSSDSRSL